MSGVSNGNSGYGYQQPADAAHLYRQQKFIFDQLMGRKLTAKIVQVMTVYDAGGNTVGGSDTGAVGLTGKLSVQPLVNMQDGVGNTQEHGIVHNIPFSRIQGGKNAILCDPQANDIGIMVIADRDISSVKANRAQANPGSGRSMDMADGMYICSLLNTEAPVQYVRFRDDGIEFVDINKNSYVTTPQGLTITDCNGNITQYAEGGITHTVAGGGLFKVVGNCEFTGTVEGNTGAGPGASVGLTTHTHDQPNDSHGDDEFPTLAPNPGS